MFGHRSLTSALSFRRFAALRWWTALALLVVMLVNVSMVAAALPGQAAQALDRDLHVLCSQMAAADGAQDGDASPPMAGTCVFCLPLGHALFVLPTPQSSAFAPLRVDVAVMPIAAVQVPFPPLTYGAHGPRAPPVTPLA